MQNQPSKSYPSFAGFALLLLALLCLAAAPIASQTSVSVGASAGNNYRVTIYNLTRDQVLSPPIAVAHRAQIGLFEVGMPAIDELALMAEDGDAGPLATLLLGDPRVLDAVVGSGPIPPGGSLAIELEGRSPFRLSVAGMLVNTNDAFFAIDTVLLPYRRFERSSYYAIAYDAGSEANNEDCDFIPGPACAGAGAGVRDTTGAEGFVYVHPGIQGVGDLGPEYDWRNPVVKVVVQRIR